MPNDTENLETIPLTNAELEMVLQEPDRFGESTLLSMARELIATRSVGRSGSTSNDTDVLVAELEKLQTVASSLPWTRDVEYESVNKAKGVVVYSMSHDDCALTVAAINGLPILLAERRELRVEVARLRESIHRGIAVENAQLRERCAWLERAMGAIAAVLAADPEKADAPIAEAECPMCSGEVCYKCGAGCWSKREDG